MGSDPSSGRTDIDQPATDESGGTNTLERMPVPDIVVLPQNLDFLFGAGMDPDPQSVTIENRGDAALNITVLALQSRPGSPTDDFTFTEDIQLPLIIEPMANKAVTIRSTPPDATMRSALLVIESNDPDKEYLSIQLKARPQVDRVTINPALVDAGKVPVGTISNSFKLEITNGDVPHTIETLEIDSNSGFTITADDAESNEGRLLEVGARF